MYVGIAIRCCPSTSGDANANASQANHRGKGSAKGAEEAKRSIRHMAMYQGSATQGLRSDQTKEISLTIASFFHSCIIPAHNASAVVVRVVGEGDGVVSRSIRMGNSVRSVFVPWWTLVAVHC
jgi:hypothetical protein